MQPNILIIVTDDQPAHTLTFMERTLSRFSDGLNLSENGYATIPLCGPMRVSFLTGVYPHNHKAINNIVSYKTYRDGLWPQRDIFARVKAKGYRTGLFGKVINGYGDAGNDTWEHRSVDRWVALASGQGQGDYEVNIDGEIRRGITQNQTSYFGEKAGAFIENGINSNIPWMCYLAFTDPHGPHDAPATFRHTHDGEVYESPAVSDTDYSDTSTYTQELERFGSTYHQGIYEGLSEEVEFIDVWVERLFKILEDTGQLDNTVVLFTTDNGYMLGEYGGVTKKGHPHDSSSKVPFLVRGPGIPEAVSGSPLVHHLDITATALGVAGADLSGIEGRLIQDLGGPDPWRRRLLVEHPGNGWTMLREDDWTYMKFYDGDVELYNKANDSYQTVNVADSNPDVVSALGQRCFDLSVATGPQQIFISEE